MSSGAHSDVTRKVAVAAAVAAGAVGVGVGLYYLTRSGQGSSRSTSESSKTKLEDMTALQLKELGNKLFAAKKYPDAVEVFSKAIERAGEGTEELTAICYQNRAAAKEFIPGSSLQEIISDCSSAIKFRPNYGKAYLRRARTEVKMKKYNEALIDLFSATHADSNIDQQIGDLLSQIIEILSPDEQRRYMDENNCVNQITPVRHERVYAWLHKITEHDPIRNDVLGNTVGDGPYFNALSLVRERCYGSVSDVADKAANDSTASIELRLKSMLLAARFYIYSNQRTKAEPLLALFDSEFAQLIEPEQEEQCALKKAKATFQIEMARDKEEVEGALAQAISLDKSEVDFYTAAAFRLTQLNELTTAREIIGRADFERTTKSTLVLHMLDILVAVTASDMASMHAGVLTLEKFVDTIEPKMAYALSLLAKIYSLFQNADGAKEALDQLLVMEPNESIHQFDSSMLATSEEDLNSRLSRSIELEPHHAEANLMLASLQLNKIGTRALTAAEYESCWSCLERATKVMTGTPDFPALDGVFRMMLILKAKRSAGERFGL